MSEAAGTKTSSPMERRRFLTALALGAGLAPAFSLSRSLFADPDAGDGLSSAGDANSLCFGTKRVLQPGDLAYLGAMRLPAQGVDLSWTYGTLTGRRVNGAVQLFMGGNVTQGDPIFEFADTGAYNPNPAQAPRMSLVRAWGNVYGTSRRTWLPSGVERTFGQVPGALHWNEATQLLYWTYYDGYNVTGIPDWCLGASQLNPSGPVAFGPWRPAGDGKFGPWRCINLGQHPNGKMLCGSTIQSGNSRSPWGPDLWTGAFPTAQTRSGFGEPDIPITKYLTYYPMIGRIASDGKFSGPMTACRRPGDYVFEPFPTELTEINPNTNGGVGSWTQLDSTHGVVWIDLPDVHGVVFTGRLAAGHVWYRNVGLGKAQCAHGVASPIDVTGPVSTDAYPALFLYDPADLEAVNAGQRTDYTVNPTAVVNAQATFGASTAPITRMGSAKTFGGSFFDAVTRKLYVAAPQADETIPGLYQPLVHVFQIR